jgi:hypothetical protein
MFRQIFLRCRNGALISDRARRGVSTAAVRIFRGPEG